MPYTSTKQCQSLVSIIEFNGRHSFSYNNNFFNAIIISASKSLVVLCIISSWPGSPRTLHGDFLVKNYC